MDAGNFIRFILSLNLYMFTKGFIYSLENAALGKPAYQVDVSHNGFANLAVDGGLSQIYGGGSCTHTATYSSPWWYVDLETEYVIDHVVVYKRLDSCCSHTFADVELYIGMDQASYSLLGYQDGQIAGVHTFQLSSPVRGKYVKIALAASNPNHLTVCEVQVMGYKAKQNLAKVSYIPSSRGTGSIIKTQTAQSASQCCYVCLRTVGCLSVNVNTTSSLCSLLSSRNTATSLTKDISHYSVQ